MNASFSFVPTADGGEIGLVERRKLGKRTVPMAEWSMAPEAMQPAIRYLLRLAETGEAATAADRLALTADQLVALPAGVATILALPPISPLSITLSLVSRIESPNGEIRVDWRNPNMRAVSPQIDGIVARTADGVGRLSAPVFRLLQSVAAYNATKGQTPDDRLTAWAPVQEQLSILTGVQVATDSMLKNISIHQAGAFALDIRQSTDGPDFDPVLMSAAMRASLADDAATPEEASGQSEDLPDGDTKALLIPDLQRSFAEVFRKGQSARPSYILARNTYLVIEPELQRALDVVQRMRHSSAAERQAFLRNPRSYIAKALPQGGDEVGTLFVETRQYSDRVTGLGLWEKPYLDWLVRKGPGWLPEGFVLRVGEESIYADEAAIQELAVTADAATERGDVHLVYRSNQYRTDDVQDSLRRLRSEFDDEQSDFKTGGDHQIGRGQREVLLVKGNEFDPEYTAEGERRPLAEPQVWPEDLVITEPKPHQRQGFGWLVQAWKAGLPGVLLADDMGLGKTLQALAFLAWFRGNRHLLSERGQLFNGPVLVVAPTALLQNWLKEASAHLVAKCLGECVRAFGAGLRQLKTTQTEEWTPEDALDLNRLRDADWILTTYETLATYHRAFARVAYSVAIFDEIQKLKAPDTINSHAAKTINADFVVGLTGTPIENRIEDIWCVMDRVSPGYLGGLRDFSRTYGGEDEAALVSLKALLDQPRSATDENKAPPIMLRRLKGDHLKGLPDRQIYSRPAIMPPVQAEAYEDVVAAVRGAPKSPGEMLKTIHRLRGISLHPQGAAGIDVRDPQVRRNWIAASARVSKTLEILHDIESKGEKALVFIEDLAVQEAMAPVIAAECGLLAEPEIINGGVAGDRRQEIVDRFQAKPPGFDVLLLSPKAAGIGLTITAANHVIHLSRWWNPAVEDQCNDRVYRIGQDRPVSVYVPIARHPGFGDSSFDVKLDALLQRKRSLSRDMLAPPISDGDTDFLYDAAVGSVGA